MIFGKHSPEKYQVIEKRLASTRRTYASPKMGRDQVKPILDLHIWDSFMMTYLYTQLQKKRTTFMHLL